MTITSIAPLSVAGLIEFHVFETGPLKLRTYCILAAVSSPCVAKWWDINDIYHKAITLMKRDPVTLIYKCSEYEKRGLGKLGVEMRGRLINM